MLKKIMKSQKGLSLIGLLCIIVLLGMIAAIAVPVIGEMFGNTKAEADQLVETHQPQTEVLNELDIIKNLDLPEYQDHSAESRVFL
ncbi:type II secretion system protein [Metabacillus arenae]|uniref:Type II secretion system protein n=1 Tax=Metabacillus arenae TaxID=2771434 RepID=A0A926NCX7_9BACI|nr:type II secretion system protein [Metabacillus arenae]MBD1381194.1 type II secretion system protein [Metabacillus arenae]